MYTQKSALLHFLFQGGYVKLIGPNLNLGALAVNGNAPKPGSDLLLGTTAPALDVF